MDKIAEMLTKIRNAQMVEKNEVSVKFSKVKFALAEILKKEGFINSAIHEKGDSDIIKINLKYYKISNTKILPAINGIQKISKSGQRIYVKSKDIEKVKNKYGISILSTSKGIMTGEESKKAGLGGEYICKVW